MAGSGAGFLGTGLLVLGSQVPGQVVGNGAGFPGKWRVVVLGSWVSGG